MTASVARSRGHLFLVGMPGAGKTTIGRQLARRRGWEFLDVDHEIEARSGVRIPTIFEYEGEDGFRRRESAVLCDIVGSPDPKVIATGGGAVLRQENRATMRDSGRVIYIDVLPEQLYERVRHDHNRPLLQVPDPMAVLRRLYADRDSYYREVADVIVQGGSGHAGQMVRRIEKALELKCAN